MWLECPDRRSSGRDEPSIGTTSLRSGKPQPGPAALQPASSAPLTAAAAPASPSPSPSRSAAPSAAPRPYLTTTAVTGCPGTYDMAPPPLPPPEQKRLARSRPPSPAANRVPPRLSAGGGVGSEAACPASPAPRCLTGASGGEVGGSGVAVGWARCGEEGEAAGGGLGVAVTGSVRCPSAGYEA